MRILVYPHDLGIGGSQLNAVELAAAVRDLGHDVVVFGRPGALVRRIREVGLEFVEAPAPGRRPSPTVARALAALVGNREIDLLHGYEWPPALDCELAARLVGGITTVSTVMSMSVPPFIPRSQTLVVGTEQIADDQRRRGRPRTRVIEPPVDLSTNHPGELSGVEEFRGTYGLEPGRPTIVSVTRFAHELKLEGTLAAIDAVTDLAQGSSPPQLVLVGDGPARPEVEERVRAARARTGVNTIVLTGQLDDPRPAYAAADIALGMGGSALRALAFGKPLVVQGERGFWSTLTEATLPEFLWRGWYGVGSSTQAGRQALKAELGPLLADQSMRARLGSMGLDVVQQRFSLERAAQAQEAIYQEAVSTRVRGTEAVLSDVTALGRYSAYYGAKRVRRAFHRECADDFNARPVAARTRP